MSPVFSGTEKLTLPEPVCDVALVTVTNEPLEVTVHAHVVPVVTVNVAVPPTPAMLKLVVEIAYVQAVDVGVGEVGDDAFFEHAEAIIANTSTMHPPRNDRMSRA